MMSRNPRLHRFALPGAAVLSALVLLAAYLIGGGAGGEGTNRTAERDPYSILRVVGTEVESYNSLTAMAGAADAVVVGRFTSFGVGRTVRGDHDLDMVVYGSATIQVLRRVGGRPLNGTVAVEFLLPYGEREARRQAAAFDAALPEGDALLFLRDKGGAEAGRYRLVNSTGLWTGTSRAPLDAPLHDEPLTDHGPYRSEIGTARSVAQLADRLAAG